MKTSCPHCSQSISIDAETLASLQGSSHFGCPTCAGAVAVPLAQGSQPVAPLGIPEVEATSLLTPCAETAGTNVLATHHGMNRNLLILGSVALLVLGGLAAFIASRKDGNVHNTTQNIRNEIINNSYFQNLIASGATTAKDLEAIGKIRPWQDGFIGVGEEPLGQEQAKELARRTGSEILAVSWGGRLFSPVKANKAGGLVTTDAAGTSAEWDQPRTVLFRWGEPSVTAAPIRVSADPGQIAEVRKDPWIDLFNGRDVSKWKGSKQDGFPDGAWGRSNDDGSLRNYHGANDQDLETRDKFKDFELEFEWKVSEGGNSGIFHGPREFQLIDDAANPIEKLPTTSSGALYDVIAPDSRKQLQPAGDYNQGRLVVNGNHVEHWINGTKVVEYELGSAALRSLVAQSKHRNVPGYCDPGEAVIGLQTHVGNVSFRKIRIRRLR